MRSFVFVALLLAAFAAANPIQHHPRMMDTTTSSGEGHQASSSSDTEVTPSGFHSSSSSSDNSYWYSNQEVEQGFQAINPLLTQFQGLMSSGQLTQTAATDFMSQISRNLGSVMDRLVGCACQDQSSIQNSFTTTINQVYQAMQSCQQFLGSDFASVVSPFQQIGQNFHTFFSSQQSSNNYVQCMGPMMTMLGSSIPSFANMMPRV